MTDPSDDFIFARLIFKVNVYDPSTIHSTWVLWVLGIFLLIFRLIEGQLQRNPRGNDRDLNSPREPEEGWRRT